VGSAADWYREERRKTLGAYVAICRGCGAARRFFDESESDLPDGCPSCGGELLRRCPACGTRLVSAFTVDCSACGAPLRPPELLGMTIRKRGR
jgi:hypothetical protein